MSIPISYSEKLGYQAQFHIFNYAYKTTKYTQWLLFPALISLGAYNLTCFSSRATSVAELTLRGLGLVLSSTPPSEKNTRGWQMLRRVPKQGMDTVAVILFAFIDTVIVFQDPKFYILSNVVQSRVNLDHRNFIRIFTHSLGGISLKVSKGTFVTAVCLFTILMFIFCSWRSPRKEPSQTIPIKVIYGLPIIDVNIQEHTLQLILDLGAHFSDLSKEVIEKIQLKEEKKTTSSMDIFGKKLIRRVFSASKILIGNYLLPYLEFNETTDFNENFGNQTPKTLIYGHIGREPFLDKVLFIDRKKQFCMVEQAYFGQRIDLEKYHPGKWIEANFTLDKGLGIRLNLTINSKEKRDLILDTGSNVSMINDDSLPKKPFNFNDKKEEMSLKLSDESSLGMFSFYLFDASNAELEGILGFDFFDCYMVCFDFLNNKVFFKKYD